MEWLEIKKDCAYEMKCPGCGFHYSPKSNEDGTISPTAIYQFCPKCGEKLDDPAKETRY